MNTSISSSDDNTFAEDVTNEATKLKENLEDSYKNVKKNGQEFLDEGVEYIEKNPVKATLIAGLIGMVLGVLLKK